MENLFIPLLVTSITAYALYHWLGRLADKDRQKRLDRLQKWIDSGGLSDAIDREYDWVRRTKK